MIINSIRRTYKAFLRNSFANTQMKEPKYMPPESQFETFKRHLENIEKVESKTEAAKLLGRLESDEQIYKEKLLELAQETDITKQQDKTIADVFYRNVQIQEEIDIQIEQNNQIENRCFKAIEHNKIYGISRICKEVIETADHINQAISIVDASNAENKVSQVSELKRIHAELAKVFGKYEIQQFCPLNQTFNPNEHESIGFIETEEVNKKNLIAEVKRTGFKIRQMLLRSAYVVIYKLKE